MEEGALKVGLYALQFDFTGIDEASRTIFQKAGDDYVPLNPTGFFLSNSTTVTLKVENADSFNHLVISVGDKEITIRPGVRQH